MKQFFLIFWSVEQTQGLLRQKKGKPLLLSICAVCDSKKSRFIKEQEATAFISSLGIKTPFSKIPILGDILF